MAVFMPPQTFIMKWLMDGCSSVTSILVQAGFFLGFRKQAQRNRFFVEAVFLPLPEHQPVPFNIKRACAESPRKSSFALFVSTLCPGKTLDTFSCREIFYRQTFQSSSCLTLSVPPPCVSQKFPRPIKPSELQQLRLSEEEEEEEGP